MLLVEMTVKCVLKCFVDIWTQNILQLHLPVQLCPACSYRTAVPKTTPALVLASPWSLISSHPLPEATTLLPWNLGSGIKPAIWRSAVTLLCRGISLRPFFPHNPKHLADKHTTYLRQTPPVSVMVKAMGTSPDCTPFRIQQ